MNIPDEFLKKSLEEFKNKNPGETSKGPSTGILGCTPGQILDGTSSIISERIPEKNLTEIAQKNLQKFPKIIPQGSPSEIPLRVPPEGISGKIL